MPYNSIRCRPLREVVSWNKSVYTGREKEYSRPLREVVSWNINSSSPSSNCNSSTSSWGRELKSPAPLVNVLPLTSTSSWGRELKCYIQPMPYLLKLSTSSWGRELKYLSRYHSLLKVYVDLFVRSWVEIYRKRYLKDWWQVDLFVRSWVEMIIPSLCPPVLSSRPLREVVSWNIVIITNQRKNLRRPLREVVSWNILYGSVLCEEWGSTSSWGRELKCWKINRWKRGKTVDLFVRSWVEISAVLLLHYMSNVDLFVRSWVEMPAHQSGWMYDLRRPLREVVSWNTYFLKYASM